MAENAKLPKGQPPQGSCTAAAHPPLPPCPDVPTVWHSYCLTIIAGIAFLFLASVFLNLFIGFRPQQPDFFVTDATLSLLNSSGNQPTADCDVKVTIFNGNKNLALNYENVRATIDYEDEPLANTSLPSFYQEKQNTTTIPVHLVIHFATGSKSSELKSGATSEGKAYLNMELRSSVQFNGGPWQTKCHTLKVYCHNVEIDWPPLSGGYPLVGRLNSVRRCETHCY